MQDNNYNDEPFDSKQWNKRMSKKKCRENEKRQNLGEITNPTILFNNKKKERETILQNNNNL